MLLAGAAKVNITPPIGIDLSGYAGRDKPAEGVHDELYGAALVLNLQDSYAAIVSADLIGISEESAKRISEYIAEVTQIPAENILIAATHTHSGAATINLRGCGEPLPAYIDILERKLAGCVKQAFDSRKPAKIGANKGRCEISVNRRAKDNQGKVSLGVNPEGPVDNELCVLRVDSLEEKDMPLAVLFNYACHAVCLGGDNYLITRDYPGYAKDLIERELNCTAMFCNGACGDVNPRERGSFAEARKLGYILGAEALKVALQIETKEPNSLQVIRQAVKLPLQPLPEVADLQRRIDSAQNTIAALKSKGASYPEYAWLLIQLEWAKAAKQIKERAYQEVELRAIIIDDNIALIGIPGELFVELGLYIKHNSNYLNTFVLGYSQGAVGYIPTEQAFKEGGYEVDAAYMVYAIQNLKAGAGELLSEAAAALLRLSP